MNESTTVNDLEYFDKPDRLARLAGSINMLSRSIRESCMETTLFNILGSNQDAQAQKALDWMEAHYSTVSSVFWTIEAISDELEVFLMDYPDYYEITRKEHTK